MTIQEYQDLKKSFLSQARDILLAEFAKLFEKYPKVKTVTWSQYTPYFNDGDPCVFSVNEPRLNGKDQKWRKTREELWQDAAYVPNPDYDQEYANKWNDFTQLVGIEDSLFEAAFGNDVEVTIDRDGNVDINDFYHD